MTNGSTQLPLVGLAGDNPLAFLASVGTLEPYRVSGLIGVCGCHGRRVDLEKLVPVNGACAPEDVVAALYNAIASRHLSPEFNDLGPNLPVATSDFVTLARKSMRRQRHAIA